MADIITAVQAEIWPAVTVVIFVQHLYVQTVAVSVWAETASPAVSLSV
jgi:hypothetical protein